MSARRKHLLVAVLGRTPQIVTETLYALCVQRTIPIQRVVIFTTLEGRLQIEQKLLSGAQWLPRLLQSFPDSFSQFQPSHLSIVVGQNTGRDLADIRSLDDHNHFINSMMVHLRELTADSSTVLHCCLAGGRKTMSVDLAMALQFWGRPQDKLYHVLVSPPEFENNPDFFYPPPEPRELMLGDGRRIATSQARIILAEVPYVRLRSKLQYLFGKALLNFDEMVRRAQAELEQLPELPPLVLDTAKRVLFIGGTQVPLPPKEFAVYWFFAERSLNRSEGTSVNDYSAYFVPARKGRFDRREATDGVEQLYGRLRPGAEPPSFDDMQSVISKIRHRIETALQEGWMSEYYVISCVGRYGDKKYGIKLDRAKITIV